MLYHLIWDYYIALIFCKKLQGWGHFLWKTSNNYLLWMRLNFSQKIIKFWVLKFQFFKCLWPKIVILWHLIWKIPCIKGHLVTGQPSLMTSNCRSIDHGSSKVQIHISGQSTKILFVFSLDFATFSWKICQNYSLLKCA